MLRAITICIITTLVCTVVGAMTYALPFPDNNTYETGGTCMFPFSRAEGRGIAFGFLGLVASWVLGPTAAITDRTVRKNRMQFDYEQTQVKDNALSLLRASSVPLSLEKAELLRAAQSESATPPQELLRAVQTEEHR
jgi:hypothetical protein